jgi:transcriptional regulator GlxA family with amidase domain
MRVAVVVFQGFEELDALGPYAILGYAADAGTDLEVELVTNDGAETVTSNHGLTVVPDGRLDGSYDLVIVPGGGWQTQATEGAWGEIQRGELPAQLTRLHEAGTAMASVCTGGMVLSAAGITRGRPAVTHEAALEALRSEGAEVVEERVVDDGDLVTSGGVTSGLDMALWLVERRWGKPLADAIARGISYERAGRVWRRPDQTGAE